jgi:hypothetical protein
MWLWQSSIDFRYVGSILKEFILETLLVFDFSVTKLCCATYWCSDGRTDKNYLLYDINTTQMLTREIKFVVLLIDVMLCTLSSVQNISDLWRNFPV